MSVTLLLLACTARSPEVAPQGNQEPHVSENSSLEDSSATLERPILPSGGDIRAVAAFTQANNAFANDIYQALPPGDLFFSPTSLIAGLGLAVVGAQGETQTQMRQLLRLDFENADEAVAHWFETTTEPNETFQIQIANRIWPHINLAIDEAYIANTRQLYDAQMEQLDYSDPSPARERINSWVAQNTQGHIEDLLPMGAVGTQTRMVLTNAIYFNAEWEQDFRPSDTRPAPFFLNDGSQIEVETMTRTGGFSVSDNDGLSVVRLPYQGGSYEMVVVMPDDPESLNDFDLTEIDALAQNTQTQLVRLTLPRLSVRYSQDMSMVLASLGMTHAFSPDADFSAMVTSEQVSLDTVFHQTFLRVDERGTEAAAATGGLMRNRSMLPPSQPFLIDHPFVFVIRDRSGAIVFAGRIIDPSEPSN